MQDAAELREQPVQVGKLRQDRRHDEGRNGAVGQGERPGTGAYDPVPSVRTQVDGDARGVDDDVPGFCGTGSAQPLRSRHPAAPAQAPESVADL